jgi:hypothetical protein
VTAIEGAANTTKETRDNNRFIKLTLKIEVDEREPNLPRPASTVAGDRVQRSVAGEPALRSWRHVQRPL